jgi:HEAT repeat protein
VRRPPLAFVLASLLALPGFDWPGGAPALSAAMEGAPPERRRELLRRAAGSRDADARALVVRALDDDSPRVRLDAAALVADARITEGAPALVRWLDDPTPAARLAALRALVALRATAALPSLARMLSDADVAIRAEAVRAAAAVGGVDATVALLDRVSDPEASVRVEAARTLGELGDARAVFTLLGALQDAAPEVRAAAALSLGRLGDARALRGLVSLVHDPDADVRVAAVRAAGALGRSTPEAVADLAAVALRESREWEPAAQTALAVEAVGALARVASSAACDVLVEVIRRGPDGADRAPARAAFRALATLPALARARVAPLVAATAPELHDSLVDLLGAVGGDDAAAALLRYVDRPSLAPSSRGRALVALGRTGSALALLPLVSEAERAGAAALSASSRDCAHPRLHAPALVGLAALSESAGTLGPDALDLLRALLARVEGACATQSAQVITLLGRTGNARAPAMIRPWLQGPSPLERASAVAALQRAGVDGAEPALAALLSDPSPAVRLAASDALARHGGAAALAALAAQWRAPAPLDRTAAARAIGRVLGRHLRAPPDGAARDALAAMITCAAQSSTPVAAACVDALAEPAGLGDAAALATLRRQLACGDEARARAALEALANASTVARRAGLATAPVEAAMALPDDASERLRVARAWSVAPSSGALDEASPAALANAFASLRGSREAPPAVVRALWEALRTRHHEAVLVNAALALSRVATAAPDVDAALALMNYHRSARVRSAAATLLRALLARVTDAPLRDGIARALAHAEGEAPAGAGDEARVAIDARVVDARGEGAAVDYALALPDGWIRMGTAGPDGWIHERDAAAGTFTVLGPRELAEAP